MFASAIDAAIYRRIAICALAAAVCAAAGYVYQLFGHGVTSLAMTLAFMPLLAGGSLNLWLWALLKKPAHQTDSIRICQNVLFAGLSTLSVGLFFTGIVDIAGVESVYPPWFIGCGAVLSAVACIRLWLLSGRNAPVNY